MSLTIEVSNATPAAALPAQADKVSASTVLDPHPVSSLFPILDKEKLDDLALDIADRGLLEPIWLHRDGRILDGRNRYAACQMVDVEPTFRTWEGNDSDLVAFVVSLNLHRRHLDDSQRAMVAAKLATLPKGTNQHASVEAPSQAEAAELMNVSRASVQRAKEVLTHGDPETVAAVEKGDVAVSAAAKTLKFRPCVAVEDAQRKRQKEERAEAKRQAEEQRKRIDASGIDNWLSAVEYDSSLQKTMAGLLAERLEADGFSIVNREELIERAVTWLHLIPSLLHATLLSDYVTREEPFQWTDPCDVEVEHIDENVSVSIHDSGGVLTVPKGTDLTGLISQRTAQALRKAGLSMIAGEDAKGIDR